MDSKRERGRIKWFDAAKGFGFINLGGNSDGIFVHYASIVGKDHSRALIPVRKYRQLFEGQAVEFEIQQCAKGFEALRVMAITEKAATK